ncbi:MAG: helix-turn-helix transcriptional regulator [Rhizobiaceae bacterium]|nr:helix-turn-helix transcriptional regulator [Rhizobiaceae bacterium]
MITANAPAQERNAGALLREWRQRRRMSQLDLALDADISQRHLSFVESGRAAPSRDMLLRLAEHLAVPLRQRNELLVAGGFAPAFGERGLMHPGIKPALSAVEQVLKGHEPYPAIAVDKGWNMLLANPAASAFLALVKEQSLLEPPINVLRLSLHPGGLAPHIVNLAEWRTHLIERLRLQLKATADPELEALEAELTAYPAPRRANVAPWDPGANVAVPLLLRTKDRVLSFISTITVFGTPLDITVSELAIESFFPADEATAAFLRLTAAA